MIFVGIAMLSVYDQIADWVGEDIDPEQLEDYAIAFGCCAIIAGACLLVSSTA